MDLFEACITSKNRTLQVCNVFKKFQRLFMIKYVDYFERIQDVLEVFTQILQNKRNADLLRTYDSCRSNAIYQRYNFDIQDLLLQPFQRISRYHLLLKELGKKRKSNASDELNLAIEETLKCVEFTNQYLNEVKRDQEDIRYIKLMFEKHNMSPVLDSGRLRLNEVIGVVFSKNSNDCPRGLLKYRHVFLFETCLLIVDPKHKKIIEKISIYDITCAKRPTCDSLKR
jgi:hypothetical protein